MTGLVEAVRRANAPRPPEASVRLRMAAGGSVAVGLLAAASEHEISRPAAGLSIALVVAGMAFSHRTRDRSLGWVKVGVAAGAMAAMAWFVHQLSGGPTGDITSVENPLTILFAWILVVHSFHVPARRDLVFALAGSAALMAVAGAQAVDMQFGLYALSWVLFGLWTLLEVGASAAGGSRPGTRMAGTSAMGVAVTAVIVFLLLPAPTAGVRLDFRSAAGSAGPVPQGGALAGDSGSPVELSHPGKASGPTRVGGYLGFAGDLDTAVRGRLSNKVVMEVRASLPSFWIGETFDHWSGQSWSSTLGRATTLVGGSPFALPTPAGSQPGGGRDDLQTFYIKDATANLVFHADNAEQVWFPSDRLYAGRDGSIVSPVGMGKGAIYSVDSMVVETGPQLLRVAASPTAQPPYDQLPKPYTDVRQLALSVTSGATNEYDKVQALIDWIGANTRYSTDIPPLPAGADSVEEFLFGNRTGYCEQISTALTVMLRTIGIPAREAVGYVPGPYNPVTDLYQVRAEDAHAWVQAWFPGYGWISFDPTAAVPDANPSPGGTALRMAGRFLARLPWVPISIPLAAAAVVTAGTGLLRRRRAAGRLSPAEAAALRMERAGRRAGRPRGPSETLAEYGAALEGNWPDVARAVQAAAYGGLELPADEWDRLVRTAELSVTRPAS
ncbi:MAG TPA: transglutaminaseTgpA domain-containing protein [Acidimicrobiales bacterium]|nr:transglutaminaseTgpA domain-containing protein [Acidimicrobiales bacterium]